MVRPQDQRVEADAPAGARAHCEVRPVLLRGSCKENSQGHLFFWMAATQASPRRSVAVAFLKLFESLLGLGVTAFSSDGQPHCHGSFRLVNCHGLLHGQISFRLDCIERPHRLVIIRRPHRFRSSCGSALHLRSGVYECLLQLRCSLLGSRGGRRAGRAAARPAAARDKDRPSGKQGEHVPCPGKNALRGFHSW